MRRTAWLICWATAAIATSAQVPSASSPAKDGQTLYTLQVNSRAVLTDVTVTDRHGDPVTGLVESDFTILDNGKVQSLASFEEHREQLSPVQEASATPGGSFSNNFLRHPPTQVNVLLFDTTNIGLLDQMYLFQQMKKFVASLPAGQPLSVFKRSGDVAVQLSGFTDDHEALITAIRKAIPHMPPPGALASDRDTLQQMAVYLSQIAGRKNLIWFTYGSDLSLQFDPVRLADVSGRREVYDLLEKERISLYPVNPAGVNGLLNLQMGVDAAATGGKAYPSTNGLAWATGQIVSSDGDYYTLTYSPDNLHGDSKWHRVEVKLRRKGCELSYRHGYFDDGSNGSGPKGRTRTLLRAGGSKTEIPNDREDVILFSVQAAPAEAGEAIPGAPTVPPKNDNVRYVVHYHVPAKDLFASTVDGNVGTDVVGAGIVAFDKNGDLVTRHFVKVTTRVDQTKLRQSADSTLSFPETIDLPPGENYLYLAVWDMTTGRVGTINAEVEVRKPARKK